MAAASAAVPLVGAVAATESSASVPTFDPARHAFGFRNWGTKTQYFESPPDPSGTTLREQIRTRWRRAARASLSIDPSGFPESIVDVIATQLRAAVTQRAGTNGHCYGMALTAQAYHTDPESIPVDTAVASEIRDPTVPFDSPEAPVYREIVDQQATQFVRFGSWLARRAILRPAWLDQRAVLQDVRAVIDEIGSASVVLFDGSLMAHQVLAYDVSESGEAIEVRVYDPNRAATAYENRVDVIRFVPDGDGVSMEPYNRYTGMLYTRFDQIERSTGRTGAGPLDHVTVTADTVRDGLFPVAQIRADSDDIALWVVESGGGQSMTRLRSGHIDRRRGAVPRIRTQYGLSQGTYRIRVLADADTTYRLRAVVADIDETRVDETLTESIKRGSVQEYDLHVTGDGSDRIERVRTGERSGRSVDVVGLGAGAVAGTALGIVGGQALERWRNDDG